MKKYIEIFEVGPRDGLQSERKVIGTQDKVKLVNFLSKCGMAKIEVSSFVSPKWVPQLADADIVFKTITRYPTVKYTALTPNLKGLNDAIAAKANEVAIFAAASETFSKKNINCSIEVFKEFRISFADCIISALSNSNTYTITKCST